MGLKNGIMGLFMIMVLCLSAVPIMAVDSSSVVIEENMEMINYDSTQINNFCDIVDGTGCTFYTAKYEYPSQPSVEIVAGVEVHPESFTQQQLFEGLESEFANYNIELESHNGETTYIMIQGNEPYTKAAAAWSNGNKVIIILIDNQNGLLNNVELGDIFEENLYEPYIAKYPSDLTFDVVEEPVIDTSDCDEMYMLQENVEFVSNGIGMEIDDIDVYDKQIDIELFNTGINYRINEGETATFAGISVTLISFVGTTDPYANLCIKFGDVVEPVQTCTESDNYYGNGNYPYVKGTFSGMYNGAFVDSDDSCLDAPNGYGDEVYSSNYLGEGYCENGELKIAFVTCPNGCTDGKCYYPGFYFDFDNEVYYEGDIIELGLRPAYQNPATIKLYIVDPDDDKHFIDLVYVSGGTTHIDISTSAYSYIFDKTGRYVFLTTDNVPEDDASIGATNSMSFEFIVDGEVEEVPGCTDPDRGSIYTKGTTTGTVACTTQENCNTAVPTTDSCNGDVLSEYVCEIDPRYNIERKYHQSYECEHGCYDGACLRESQDTNCKVIVNGAVVKRVFASDREHCYSQTSFGSRNCAEYNNYFREGKNTLEQYYKETDRVNSDVCYVEESDNYQKISGISGNKGIYAPGEKIKLVVKGIEVNDGSPAEMDEGWAVQYYTYDTRNTDNYLNEYLSTGNYNAQFDGTYWEAFYWAPQEEGKYYTEVVLYCSRDGSKCMREVGHDYEDEVRQKVYFEVDNDAIPEEDGKRPDLVIRNARYNKHNSGLATIDFDIYNAGTDTAEGEFAIAVYVDGRIQTHTIYSPDLTTGLKSRETYHKSISNYNWLTSGDLKRTITLVVDRFEGGEEDNPVYEGFRDNMIDESNENNNKVEFTLGDSEEVPEIGYSQRTFWVNDWKKIEMDVDGQTHVFAVADIDEDRNRCSVYVDGTSKWLNVREKDRVNRVKLMVNDVGIAVSTSGGYEMRQCQITVFGSAEEEVEIVEEEIVVPISGVVPISRDGSCIGCVVGNSCITNGIRFLRDNTPSFCDFAGNINEQKEDEEACQNDYECLSNTCGNGECQDFGERLEALEQEVKETKGILNRIFGWLARIFGGE